MSCKNGVLEAFRLDLEASRLDFGGPGARFWRLKAQFFHDFRMFLAELRLWSKMGFKKPFGGIWDGFGEDLERILEGFEKVLARFLGGFEKFWEDLGKVLKAFSQAFLCQDPRAVSRSPAERLNARGSSPQREEPYTLKLSPSFSQLI